MSFSIIAAVGKNRELGRDGKLLWHLPEDLQFFKKTTMGHPILMGRKTFESLPSMLPGRKHYVITRGQVNHPDRRISATTGAGDREPARNDGTGDRCRRQDDSLTSVHNPAETDDLVLQDDNLTFVHNPAETDDLVFINNLSEFARQPHDEEIFVIGGGMIYQEMLGFADTLYLTEIDAEAPDADTFFPEFDTSDYSREVLGKGSKDGINYQFVKYTRN